VAAIHWVVSKLGLTYKKRRSMRLSKTGRMWRRPAPLATRQGGLDPTRLVFIDESAAKTNLTRLRGRAPRGDDWSATRRTATGAPHDDLLGAAGWDQRLSDDRGATDTDVFQAYVREVLVPSLRAVISSSWTTSAPQKRSHAALIAQARAEVASCHPTRRISIPSR